LPLLFVIAYQISDITSPIRNNSRVKTTGSLHRRATLRRSPKRLWISMFSSDTSTEKAH